ncbi:MAG: prepilin-type N-terminal cleavage/methylation domain-containing protein [Cyanobacteria bacterium P01_G01_bin.38]
MAFFNWLYRNLRRPQSGFTLTEVLIVAFMMGLIAAISAPSYLQFVERGQLIIAQGEVYQGIRQAQAKAQQNSSAWRFGIREASDAVEWATYPDGTTSIYWRTLGTAIKIDSETSLRRSSSGIYSVKFDYKGNAKVLGRVTLSGKKSSKIKRCVIVSTLLGEVRKAKAQSTPDPTYRRRDRYCY